MGRKAFTKEYLLAKLHEAVTVLGKSPTQNSSRDLKDFPSRGAFRIHFGTFAKAMEVAGLPLLPKNFSHNNNRVRKSRLTCSKSDLRKRFRILERDGFACVYCGRNVQDGAKLVIDHVIPYSKEGPTSEDNLVTCCFECNMGKRDFLLTCHINKKASKG